MSTFTLKLKKVDPVKYAVIATLTYLALMLVVGIPFMLLFSAFGASQSVGLGLGMLGGGIFLFLFAIIFYGVIIFIITLVAGLILNFILGKTGGLPMDFEKAGFEVSNIGQDFLNENN